MTYLSYGAISNNFALLINSYVQKNASIEAYEIYCAEKGYVYIKVSIEFILFLVKKLLN
jgi:hypothetical protein